MRMREFFESAEFKNEPIDLRTFKPWYSKNIGNGEFTYANDWAAFNFPIKVFEDFKEVQGRLYSEERKLLRFLKSNDKALYLIATSKVVESDHRYLQHEIAHFLFATNPSYRRAVKLVLKSINRKPIFEWLKRENYHRTRFWDETHSYLLDGPKFLKEDVGVCAKPYLRAISKLKKLLKTYQLKS